MTGSRELNKFEAFTKLVDGGKSIKQAAEQIEEQYR